MFRRRAGRTTGGPGPGSGAPPLTPTAPLHSTADDERGPVRTRITHPQGTTTAASTATTATAALAAGCAGLLLVLTGCDSSSATDPSAASATGTATAASATGAKNGDTPPVPRVPVPRGEGSRVPYDFNGDGRRDLVINSLVKAPGERHGDDAGTGIVYGTEDAPLDPGARQLLSARENAAKSGNTLPAAFEAEAACDLDRDGFTDLVVSTDPRTTASAPRPCRSRSCSARHRAWPARRSPYASRRRPAPAMRGLSTRSAATSTATAAPTWRSPRATTGSPSCAAPSPAPGNRPARPCSRTAARICTPPSPGPTPTATATTTW